MAEREKEDWYVAGRHAITSGFAIPLILSSAYAFALAPALGLDTSNVFASTIGVVVSVASVWLGVKYSAQYLRRFSELNRARVVNLASLYFFLILVVFFVPTWFEGGGDILYRAIDSAGAIASVAVFYYASRRELLS